MKRHEETGVGIPIFPLNTGGIGLWGLDECWTIVKVKVLNNRNVSQSSNTRQDIVVENVCIENFDDTIVPKPSDMHLAFDNCTENIVVNRSPPSWHSLLSLQVRNCRAKVRRWNEHRQYGPWYFIAVHSKRSLREYHLR